MREMSSGILIHYLGLQYKDNIQGKIYLIPCKKPPTTATTIFSSQIQKGYSTLRSCPARSHD